jgi:PAS domain S-box-containing protein
MPIVATVLLGRIAGVISILVSIASIVFCTYAAQTGLATPSPHTPEELRFLFSSVFIFLAVGVAVYAFIYESMIVAALKESDDARQELETKAGELVESRDFLLAVMENAHDGIIAADLDRKLSVFNRAAREFHGLDPSPLTEEEWPEFFHVYHPDGKTLVAAKDLPLARALKGEKVTDCELALRAPGEEPNYILVSASPLTSKTGERIGAVATVRDITVEKLQEEEIRGQNREIDQFARVAAVDLQAPLNRIVLTTDALLNTPEAQGSAKMRNDLASMSAAAEKMGALIKDVLYMSRLPIGDVSLQPVIARDCIEAAIDLSGVSEADCRLDFRFGGSPDVTADPKRLTTVYQILIENAWKHAQPGAKAHVEFTCKMEDGATVLGVKDNGPGMTPEEIARLFLPLERLPVEAGHEGAGLGLAICRKSVARMGGEFWVESEPGNGCHFRLRLPLAQRTAMAS